LQLDSLAVEVYRAYFEVDPDCGDEGGCEAIFRETKQAAGFPDTGVAD